MSTRDRFRLSHNLSATRNRTTMTADSLPLASVSSLSAGVQSIDIKSSKPVDLLYPSKPYIPSPSNSLSRMMCNRSSLKAAHSAFIRKTISFAPTVKDEVDYGYGEDEPAPRPTKRRRFERRNSKTPAMLMAMSAAALDLDFLEKDDKECRLVDDDDDDDDNWDGGLEIAEELVKQLQERRRSNASSG